MSKKYYRPVDLPGFEGLIFAGEEFKQRGHSDRLEVSEVININVVVGDRNLRFPIPQKALYIDRPYFQEYDGSFDTKEFSSDNTFGSWEAECNLVLDQDRKVTWVRYQNALTVTVQQGPKTIYAQNFFKQTIRWDVIEMLTRLKPSDFEYLLFELQEFKEQEIE